jgi:hypothetical protein
MALAVVVASCAPTSVSTSHGDPPAVIVGTVLAGPTCPVVQEPPDPACADRAVEGAEIVVLAADGTEVARVRSDREGHFRVEVGPGDTYQVVPQPVEGLMGTAEPVEVAPIDFGDQVEITLSYDTGIR